jgi:hypothetical protein
MALIGRCEIDHHRLIEPHRRAPRRANAVTTHGGIRSINQK